MKISSKGRYAMEALLCMAVYYEKTPVRIKDIIEKTNIPERYLEQIFFKLRKAGVLGSVHGSAGGYYLKIEPGGLTAETIVYAVEGEPVTAPCVKDVSLCNSAVSGSCVTRSLWKEMTKAVEGVLEQVTLKELKDKFVAETGETA